MNFLRGVIFFIYMTATALALSLFLAPLLAFGEAGARATASVWCRAALGGLRVIGGIRWRVSGLENLPDGPAIIAANHQSMWETLYLCATLDRPAFVVKHELLAVPVFGFWLSRSGAIALDRKAGPTALKSLGAAASKKLAEGCKLVIFPEGTRTAPAERRRLHPGVAAVYAATGASCVPVGHDSGRYWLHPGPEKRPGVIEVRFRPAIAPGLERRTFLTRLAAEIALARVDLAENSSADEVATATAARFAGPQPETQGQA